MRNLTLIKCTPGRPVSYGTSMPVAGLGHPAVMVERKRFVNELSAVRIQATTNDLPYSASASPHERRS